METAADLTDVVGTCAACDQPLIREGNDCWHPWYVARACPPERPLDETPAGEHPWTFGDGYLRPGLANWRPVDAPRRAAIIAADGQHAVQRMATRRGWQVTTTATQ